MGKDKKKVQQNAQAGMANVGAQAQQRYESTQNPSNLENEMAPIAQNMNDQYNKSVYRQQGDYGDIMSSYDNFANSGGPSNFSFKNVQAKTPDELKESYGYLREAAPGYRGFADNGGYSAQDVQELRARGVSPIRSAYGNSMMEMDRARSLGGNGGATNYIAAASKAQRELPGQMADAMTNVNAGLAESIREGKKFGLQGLTQTGSTMGGLSSADAERILRADLSNQSADIQTQGMREQSLRASRGETLQGLAGKTSLYGTTPAMANMFGNQALSAYQQRGSMETNRNQYGLGLLGAQMQAYGPQANQPQGPSKLSQGMGIAATVAPYVAQYYGGRNKGAVPMGATDIGGAAQMSYGTTPYW